MGSGLLNPSQSDANKLRSWPRERKVGKSGSDAEAYFPSGRPGFHQQELRYELKGHMHSIPFISDLKVNVEGCCVDVSWLAKEPTNSRINKATMKSKNISYTYLYTFVKRSRSNSRLS